MIKSRFSLWIFLPFALFIAIPIMVINLYLSKEEAFGENVNFKFIILSSLLTVTFIWLTFGLIRKRIQKITIQKNIIEIRNVFGSTEKHNLKDFDGYIKTVEISKGGNYEVLILIKKQRRTLFISQFVYKNYIELKNSIETEAKDLGFSRYSFIEDLKD